MRECAGRAFFSAECTDASRRAVYSDHRPSENFEVGQLVYFWSVGHFNKVASSSSLRVQKAKSCILAWSLQSHSRPIPIQFVFSISRAFGEGCSRQRRLCSQDEDATCSDVLKRLCQVRDDLRHARISGISDIVGEDRPPNPEHPTGKRRHFSKQPPFSALKH